MKRTHYRRADGLRAELVANRDGTAIYKVDATRRIGRGRDARIVLGERMTSCSSGRFAQVFAEAA